MQRLHSFFLLQTVGFPPLRWVTAGALKSIRTRTRAYPYPRPATGSPTCGDYHPIVVIEPLIPSSAFVLMLLRVGGTEEAKNSAWQHSIKPGCHEPRSLRAMQASRSAT
jgi:hypothetical protein